MEIGEPKKGIFKKMETFVNCLHVMNYFTTMHAID